MRDLELMMKVGKKWFKRGSIESVNELNKPFPDGADDKRVLSHTITFNDPQLKKYFCTSEEVASLLTLLESEWRDATGHSSIPAFTPPADFPPQISKSRSETDQEYAHGDANCPVDPTTHPLKVRNA